jgi:Zn-dependent alcohol dehydrogenase
LYEAGKLSNCCIIIAVDRIQDRLDLAKDLGATHLVNTSQFQTLRQDLIDAVHNITSTSHGPTITVDCSGSPALIEAGVEFTAPMGSFFQVGVPPPGYKLETPDLSKFMMKGTRIMGAIEGDTNPRDWIPKLIQWWKEGSLPIGKFSKMFKANDWREAVDAMENGTVVKPIILWL